MVVNTATAAPVAPTGPSRTMLIVFSAALLGSFTSGLGAQMVNSSIADIQGSIHASADEASWISTAYSMGEIMIIPVSGMLMQVVGPRRFMLACWTLFIITALFSAMAGTLEAEIALRAVQGIAGGAFGVAAFGMVFRTFPTRGRAFGLMLLTFCQTFPANLGAYISGYLTNLQYGWPFFVNPINKAHGWSLASIQFAFTVFIALESWLTPIEGWISEKLGARRGPKMEGAFGGLMVAVG